MSRVTSSSDEAGGGTGPPRGPLCARRVRVEIQERHGDALAKAAVRPAPLGSRISLARSPVATRPRHLSSVLFAKHFVEHHFEGVEVKAILEVLLDPGFEPSPVNRFVWKLGDRFRKQAGRR